MPFSPSDFEWWVWALFTVGAVVACAVCALIAAAADGKNVGVKGLFGFFAATSGLCAFGCGVITVIRFVKWVWG